ncbi:Gfo/Idh/MocA family protein [Autumnicola edwardsiae]|jgi:predicted dehydrogenase|uniref:Gfo/Idh/MocA family oxidoreductase n=1 Tax=Autumnicola edwardsiae TaxID=3075594 RepID=A0ABU3CRV3_9FLAO|nr:Gfo/Idh/MocA family oxidoreductase [Zunongwangia sp. F297]MDT0649086.1 Gfo/Idh/MocA family oxidoreductase [Zunongwangia sp. F297]
MNNIRFAVVGCGHIGKRHLKVILGEENAELTAICDNDTGKLEAIKNSGIEAHFFDDYEKMLQESNVDIVCICTPHGLHAEMSILAAKYKKHILVEKPMSLNSSEGREMIKSAEENGVRLYVVKQNRYNKPIHLANEALKNKKLGKVFMVQCNVLWNRNQEYYEQSSWRGRKSSEGGALFTQVSHFLDLLVWWFGEIEEAKTLVDTLNHEIEIEDCGVSALKFKNGSLGSIMWTNCVYNSNYEGSITILGEKGTIKIGGQYLNEIEYWDVNSYPLPIDVEFEDKPNSYGTYQGSSSNHDKLVHELVLEIIQDRKGVVEGEEGLKSIEAIEKIYRHTKLQ